MSQGAKLQMLVNHGVFIPEGAKICLDHLELPSQLIRDDFEPDKTRFKEELQLDQEQVNKLYRTLVSGILNAQKKQCPLDFDTPGREITPNKLSVHFFGNIVKINHSLSKLVK